jgi:outer membrane protein
MKIRVALPALMVLLLVPAAWGQAGSAAAPASGSAGKVAVINIQTAITGTSEGKQAAAELQSKYTPRQTELDNMRKQIEDIQTRLRNGATTLSDEEKQRLAQEGDRLTRSFQRKQQELQDDGQEDQREVVDRIGRKMLDVIDKYSKENGYSVVFDISAQNTPVVYAANHIDITQDIVRLFDQAYPVRTGTAPKPAAAQRPAATTPAPPKQPQ